MIPQAAEQGDQLLNIHGAASFTGGTDRLGPPHGYAIVSEDFADCAVAGSVGLGKLDSVLTTLVSVADFSVTLYWNSPLSFSLGSQLYGIGLEDSADRCGAKPEVFCYLRGAPSCFIAPADFSVKLYRQPTPGFAQGSNPHTIVSEDSADCGGVDSIRLGDLLGDLSFLIAPADFSVTLYRNSP
ncbi:hypothetical protein [Synechococcus sp. EJ6-Ellesmere]|uniref:hypothetical protein n=1 Tax=Synechococcus sp. EJ6-Ellesmere TaxID=2823734 RepID=UPI0020CDCBFC|nr:hypothetical protein [Synechococcus sp. EJ6-Ellesmere]MCP9823891.1 hypothetical protein [Synechococcus sp. EJ6-Ellesmere]